jgi:hypothetical protein
MTDVPSRGAPKPVCGSPPRRMLAGPDVSTVACVIFILIAMCCGGFVRFSAVLSNSFSLGDGGLFYDMVNDLLANRLPYPRASVTTALFSLSTIRRPVSTPWPPSIRPPV